MTKRTKQARVVDLGLEPYRVTAASEPNEGDEDASESRRVEIPEDLQSILDESIGDAEDVISSTEEPGDNEDAQLSALQELADEPSWGTSDLSDTRLEPEGEVFEGDAATPVETEELPEAPEQAVSEPVTPPEPEQPTDLADVGADEAEITGPDPDAAEPIHEPRELLSREDLDAKRAREADEVDALPAEDRLDYGLPTEGEISSARSASPFLHFLHAIGNGLLAGSGRAPIQHADRADQLQAQRRQGLAQRLSAKLQGQQRAESSELAREMARARLDQQAQHNAALEALATRRADISEQAQQGVADRARARSGERREEQQRLLNPESQESRAAQDAAILNLSQLDQRRQDAIMEAIHQAFGPDATIRDLSAQALEDLNIPEIRLRPQSGGPGSGLGAGRGSDRRTALEGLLRTDLQAAHPDWSSERVSQEIASYGTGNDAHTLDRMQSSHDEMQPEHSEGETFVAAEPEGQDPLQLSARVYADAPSQRAVRDVLRGYRQVASALGEIDRIRQQYSAVELAIPGSPGNRALNLANSRLATAQSAISNAGTINAGEREIYLMDAPTPVNWYDTITGSDSTYRAQMDAWRHQIDTNVSAILETGGVPRSQVARWQRFYSQGIPRGRESSSPSSTRPSSTSASSSSGRPSGRRVSVTDRSTGDRVTIIPHGPNGTLSPAQERLYERR